MSDLITTKTLHKIVGQTFKKYNALKPSSKTRRVNNYSFSTPNVFRKVNNLRRIEFTIQDAEDLDQILQEIKVMLTLYGYDDIIREVRNPYSKKTRLDIYARMV